MHVRTLTNGDSEFVHEMDYNLAVYKCKKL